MITIMNIPPTDPFETKDLLKILPWSKLDKTHMFICAFFILILILLYYQQLIAAYFVIAWVVYISTVKIKNDLTRKRNYQNKEP